MLPIRDGEIDEQPACTQFDTSQRVPDLIQEAGQQAITSNRLEQQTVAAASVRVGISIVPFKIRGRRPSKEYTAKGVMPSIKE